jgi:aerobic-type carbon monoxide dehydrogenase small subunit (CoxS/CutS family)
MTVTMTVNGVRHTHATEPRRLLSDFLREDLGLTGTHVGCEHGVCGACTVLWEGRPVRACLAFAVQADGAALTTVEGLASDGAMHPMQQAFADAHALQCGFCTPGFLLAAVDLLRRVPDPGDDEIRRALAGHLCRCTGYVNIVKAVRLAAQRNSGSTGATESEAQR